MAKALHNLLCRLGVHQHVYYGTPDGRRSSCYRSDYCRGRVFHHGN